MRLRCVPHAIVLLVLACSTLIAAPQFSVRTEAINKEHLAMLKSWAVGKTKVAALTGAFDVVDPFFDRLGILALQKTGGRSVYTIGTYPGTSRRLESSALVALVRGAQASLERIDKVPEGDLHQAEGLEVNPTCIVEFDGTGVLTSIVWQ